MSLFSEIPSQALFGRSKELLEAGKSLGEAESMVEEMLEIVDDPRARLAGYRLLGALIHKNPSRPDAERLERSEAAYGEALRLTSGYDWASRLSLAIIERERGATDEALQHLRAIDISTLDADSRLTARVMLCRLKREAQASITVSPSDTALSETPRQPPMMISGDVQPPEKIFAPSPQYTSEARRLGLTGLVIFTGSIDRDGCTDMQLAKADDERLAAMATQAVDQWVFEPATLRGKPVPVHYNLSFKMRASSMNADIPLLRIDPMY